MEKEFIPYEQALSLKELGFDEDCLARFDGGGFRMLPVCDPLKNSEIKEHWFCVTPLYQQAFRWLLEEYNLYMPIHRRVYEGKICFTVTGGTFGNKLTYLEAQKDCLKKLIEIAAAKKIK